MRLLFPLKWKAQVEALIHFVLFGLCRVYRWFTRKKQNSEGGNEFAKTSISIGAMKSTCQLQRLASSEKEKKRFLTYGAVGSGPLVVADAGSRLGAEGAVIGALLGTSALEDLAADAPPARVAVALSVMTGSVTGA